MTECNAIVSGGTKGIGLEICKAFAREGYNIVTCSRSEEDLQNLKKELSHQIRIEVFQADFRKREEVIAFAQFARDQFDSFQILVNNAGVFQPGSVLNEKEDTLDFQLDVNLKSAYYLSRAIVPAMLKIQSGHVFNIVSIAGLKAYPNGGGYCISKFALNGFSKVLREECKDKGVKVTAVHPGATWSNSWKGADFPRDRLMEAEDIAKMVVSCFQLGPSAVVEEIIIRPQKGDL